MDSFLPFFIILSASVFSSTILRKFHIPWVIALILAGAILGPFGLNLIPSTEVLQFLSETGLIFLMFSAGLETQLSSFEKFQGKVVLLAVINGFLPLLIGVGVGLLFNYSLLASILVGIIFVSSSIAVVVPSLEPAGLISTTLGKSVIASSVLQDIASMLLLSIFLQTQSPETQLPLYIFYPTILVVLFGLKYFLPNFTNWLNKNNTDSVFQNEVRITFLALFGVVILFELLGLHSIIAAFFAGLILSDTIQTEELKSKLHTISYGMFVPVFFVLVGKSIDFGVFSQLSSALALITAVVFGSILSKLVSGTLGGRLVGFNKSQSLFFGASSIPQLSTTLAAVFSAASSGLLSPELVTALIILSVISTLIGPISMNYLSEKSLSKKDLYQTPLSTSLLEQITLFKEHFFRKT